MTTGRQHHKEITEFPPPTHICLRNLYSPCLPFWIRREPLCGWSELTPAGALRDPLPSPASAKRQRDGQRQNTLGTGAKWGRRDWAEWGVALSFPDNIMNQQGVGESSEMETVNRTGQGKTLIENVLLRAEKEDWTESRGGNNWRKKSSSFDPTWPRLSAKPVWVGRRKGWRAVNITDFHGGSYKGHYWNKGKSWNLDGGLDDRAYQCDISNFDH